MAQQETEPSGPGSPGEAPREGDARRDAKGAEAEAAAKGGSGGSSSSSSSSSSPAAPELSWEEFECRICYNLFDLERHAPKLLECLHTFCLECLRELSHPRPGDDPDPDPDSPRSSGCRRGSPRGGGGGGRADPPGRPRALPAAAAPAAASVSCPVCRHRTALPGGLPHSLPVHTKLVEGILLQLRGWAPLLRDLRPPQGLPWLPPRPAQASPQSPGGAATPTSATVTFPDLEAPRAGAEETPDGGGGRGGPCFQRCREKAGCVCFVFLVLAMALFGFAWMEWLTGSIFLGVALLLLFLSTMPFMYGFRLRREPRTIFSTRAAGGGSREGTSCRSSTPGGRPAVDGRGGPW